MDGTQGESLRITMVNSTWSCMHCSKPSMNPHGIDAHLFHGYPTPLRKTCGLLTAAFSLEPFSSMTNLGSIML